MNILDKIVDKKREVILKKSIIPVSQLKLRFSLKETISLSQSLGIVLQVIAEHKRRSPSKSVINHNFTVEEVVKATKMRVCGFCFNRWKVFWRFA
jgi:indole-3-glycerol phosphate synthase